MKNIYLLIVLAPLIGAIIAGGDFAVPDRPRAALPGAVFELDEASIPVAEPVAGPWRCTSTMTSGVSVITASPWNSVFKAMPGPEVIVSAVFPA